MTRALAIVLVLVLAITAHADDKDRAKTYYQAGVKAYAAQNFAAAAADFDEAYRAVPVPEVAFSAAQAYRRLYRLDPNPEHIKRAIELYRAYLDKVKTGGRVGDAADSLGELQRELDRLGISAKVASAPAVEHTRLGVNVSISDRASITDLGAAMKEVGDATGELVKGLVATIDGKPVEPFALVDVSPGEHAVQVSAEGYFAAQRTQRAVQGVSDLVDLELKPKPATIKVNTEDGASVSVDGRIADVPSKIEVPAGKHFILVTHRGREPFAREVATTRGQALSLDAPLAHTQKRKVLPFVVGGAGLLGGIAVIAVIATASANSDAEKLNAKIRTIGNATPGDAKAYKADVDRRDKAATGAWVVGGLALAAGTAAFALYYFDTPSSEGLRLAPMMSPGTAGAMVLGRF